MLRPRIIPCLLIQNGGLVKTTRFANPKYVGDPINVVRIFNEKEVDELTVLDIDATVKGRDPDFTVIERLASECHMPLCYGGGIKDSRQIKRIIGLGVEKVALSSAVVDRPELVSEGALWVGNQSIVVVLDVKKRSTGGGYEVYTHNGLRATGQDPVEMARRMEAAGAGEIVVNSIDSDGVMTGYDLQLIQAIREATSIPLTCLGGAGSLADIGLLIRTCGTIGAGAGSLFVFKGTHRAVLVNYPRPPAKDALIHDNLG